jgi:uncharacterized membrane protein YsdA (DUF1294 family)/cold shock CspA family protein
METEEGTITKWNDEKGFGFITPKFDNKQIFIHIKQYSKDHKRPVQGLAVNFQRMTDPKGRFYAVNISPTKGHKNIGQSEIEYKNSIIMNLLFFVSIGALIFLNKLPIYIIIPYIIFSPIAFNMYVKDKLAAEWDEWRTPENTLHFISLIGGWPGALLAQSKLRHKSKKVSFKVVFWITVILNCSFLALLLSPQGSAFQEEIKNILIG